MNFTKRELTKDELKQLDEAIHDDAPIWCKSDVAEESVDDYDLKFCIEDAETKEPLFAFLGFFKEMGPRNCIGYDDIRLVFQFVNGAFELVHLLDWEKYYTYVDDDEEAVRKKPDLTVSQKQQLLDGRKQAWPNILSGLRLLSEAYNCNYDILFNNVASAVNQSVHIDKQNEPERYPVIAVGIEDYETLAEWNDKDKRYQDMLAFVKTMNDQDWKDLAETMTNELYDDDRFYEAMKYAADKIRG